MKVSEQEVADDPHFRLFNLTLEAETIKQRIDSKLQELAPKASMQGFRVGKVPLDILRRQYRGQLTEEAIQSSLNEAVAKIIADNELIPAMDPEINVDSYEEKKDLVCTVGIVNLPQITLPDFSTISLEKYQLAVSDDLVDNALSNLQRRQASSKPIEPRSFKQGDLVVIDYLGTNAEGEKIQGAEGKDISVELGAKSFSEELEKAMIKANVGDEISKDVSYPADNPRPDLAGQTITYNIKIKDLREIIIPEIDNDFAQKLGLDSLDALRDTVKQSIAREYEMDSKELLKRALLDKLNLMFTDMDSPKKMVEKEFSNIWQQYITSKQENNLSEEEAALSEKEARDIFDKLAIRRVKLALVLTTVSRSENVSISEQEIERAIEQIVGNYPNNQKEARNYYKTLSARQQLQASLMEDKLINTILEKVKIEVKEISLEELQDKVRVAESFSESANNEEEVSNKSKKKSAKSSEKKSPEKESSEKSESKSSAKKSSSKSSKSAKTATKTTKGK